MNCGVLPGKKPCKQESYLVQFILSRTDSFLVSTCFWSFCVAFKQLFNMFSEYIVIIFRRLNVIQSILPLPEVVPYHLLFSIDFFHRYFIGLKQRNTKKLLYVFMNDNSYPSFPERSSILLMLFFSFFFCRQEMISQVKWMFLFIHYRLVQMSMILLFLFIPFILINP